MGGDTVDIDDHVELDPQTGEKKYVFTVKVNGEILDESAYIHLDEENYAKISTYSFPITVEEGKIFVLGDNRLSLIHIYKPAPQHSIKNCVLKYAWGNRYTTEYVEVSGHSVC